MTELQWLIKLLTKHKLNSSIRDLVIARIGEVEASLVSRPQTSVIAPRLPVTTQAASTQRILDEMTQEAPISPIAPQVAPRITVPQEIVTSKGNGTSTRGPRKF